VPIAEIRAEKRIEIPIPEKKQPAYIIGITTESLPNLFLKSKILSAIRKIVIPIPAPAVNKAKSCGGIIGLVVPSVLIIRGIFYLRISCF